MDNKLKIIDSFTGDYFFLSNFYEAPIEIFGLTYRSNEAAFQAMKCKNPEDRIEFVDLNPSEAKKLGRHIPLRFDWEKIKYNLMSSIVTLKFKQNKELREKLLCTRPAILIEGNSWGDKEWGMVDGVGNNMLGIILMEVRERLWREYKIK